MEIESSDFYAIIGSVLAGELEIECSTNKRLRVKIGSAAVRAVFGLIEQQVLAGQRVPVQGFGTFEPAWIRARLGYSKKAGGNVVMPGRFRVLFRAGPTLRYKMRDARVSEERRECEALFEAELWRHLERQNELKKSGTDPGKIDAKSIAKKAKLSSTKGVEKKRPKPLTKPRGPQSPNYKKREVSSETV